ncbi:hypothetical protein D9M72_421870 [compost metagenome]
MASEEFLKGCFLGVAVVIHDPHPVGAALIRTFHAGSESPGPACVGIEPDNFHAGIVVIYGQQLRR